MDSNTTSTSSWSHNQPVGYLLDTFHSNKIGICAKPVEHQVSPIVLPVYSKLRILITANHSKRKGPIMMTRVLDSIPIMLILKKRGPEINGRLQNIVEADPGVSTALVRR